MNEEKNEEVSEEMSEEMNLAEAKGKNMRWGIDFSDIFPDLDDDDDDFCPCVEEHVIDREGCIKRYRAALHGIDIAIAQERGENPSHLPLEVAEELLAAIRKADDDIIVNLYFNRSRLQPHALVVSRLSEYEVIAALSHVSFYHSVAPAFRTDEANADVDTYFHMVSGGHEAETLRIY